MVNEKNIYRRKKIKSTVTHFESLHNLIKSVFNQEVTKRED